MALSRHCWLPTNPIDPQRCGQVADRALPAILDTGIKAIRQLIADLISGDHLAGVGQRGKATGNLTGENAVLLAGEAVSANSPLGPLALGE